MFIVFVLFLACFSFSIYFSSFYSFLLVFFIAFLIISFSFLGLVFVRFLGFKIFVNIIILFSLMHFLLFGLFYEEKKKEMEMVIGHHTYGYCSLKY